MSYPFLEPNTDPISLDEPPCPPCDGEGWRVHEGELLGRDCDVCGGSGLLKDYNPSSAPFPDGF